MARRTATDTLEQPMTTSAEDESWRDQSIPSFDDPPPALSHEQQLQDLDGFACTVWGWGICREREEPTRPVQFDGQRSAR